MSQQQQVSDSSTAQGLCKLNPDQWHYQNEDSAVAKFGLVCNEAWKVQFVNTLMFVGCFIGAGVWGRLNDSFGRRKPLFIASAVAASACLCSAAAPSYWFLAAMRVAAGMGAAGQSQCIVLIATETCGPSCRGLAGTASLALLTFGEFTLVAVAHSFPKWSQLMLAAGILSAATLLLSPVIPESARWLVSRGRGAEAVAVMRRLSANHRDSMPPDVLDALMKCNCAGNTGSTGIDAYYDTVDQRDNPDSNWHSMYINDQQQHNATPQIAVAMEVAANSCDYSSIAGCSTGACADDMVLTGDPPAVHAARVPPSGAGGSAESSLTLLQLLRHTPAELHRTLVLLLAWFALYMTAFGVVLGAGALPGTIYVTFTMMAAAELAAMMAAAATVDKLGRHSLIAAGLVIGACGCLGGANAASNTPQAVLAIFGKFGCTLSLAVIGIYTAELFPTPVRARAMGMFNQASRMGSIAAPLMLMAGSTLQPASNRPLYLPLLVFGALSLLACVGVLLVMPETHGRPMPETLQDLEQLQSFMTAKPWQRGWWACACFLVRSKAGPAAAAAEPGGYDSPADARKQENGVGNGNDVAGKAASTNPSHSSCDQLNRCEAGLSSGASVGTDK